MVLLQSTPYVIRIVQFSSNPEPIVKFGHLIRRSAATKRIKDNVVNISRHQNRSLRDHQLKLVDVGADLEFPVSVRRSVSPEISEVDSAGIHFVAVPSVVLDLLATMAARLNRNAKSVEHAWSPARIVQKGVVGRVEFPSARVGTLHR